jgi:DNA polymerase V
MEDEFFGSAYRGSKQFRQQQVKTANATGFGAAADDYMERGIDLNEQLIMNKPATFFFRMNGEAMTGCGIFPDDVLIVDRSIKPTNGKVIVAAVNGELLIRRFQQTIKGVILVPENKQFKPIEIGEFSNYSTWGVVTCVIHIMDPALINFRNNNHHRQIRDSQ